MNDFKQFVLSHFFFERVRNLWKIKEKKRKRERGSKFDSEVKKKNENIYLKKIVKPKQLKRRSFFCYKFLFTDYTESV